MTNINTAKTNKQSDSRQHITVGLDIGTSKLCCLVASPDAKAKSLNILGIGIAESDGLNRGVVVNIDKTVRTIQKVIEQAEQQSGIEIKEVVAGIAGDHIESFQSRGIVGISNPAHEIAKNDVERLLDESKNIAISDIRQILHVISQDYIIDGQDGIIDPIGMSGVRMEGNVYVVTGLKTAIHNIYKCVERNNIRVKDIVLEPLACSYAVLNDEEKEVGVALIDIGGGTTDIAIFEGNVIRFTSVFAIAGKQVTDDVRRGLGIIANQAERIKREYGHSYLPSLMKDDIFMIPGIGGRKPMEIKKSYLCQIIQPRLEEIFEFALAEIRRSGFSGSLGAGVVITGGCSLISGIEELAQAVFGMPVKIGIPSGITYSGLAPEVENPIYSTAVGLALYGLKDYERLPVNEIQEPAKEESPKTKGNIFKKVKKYFEEL
ncbi:MAG: cell division protein FtsA [FCB group bacterium]|jgi:cell division protein FtsA